MAKSLMSPASCSILSQNSMSSFLVDDELLVRLKSVSKAPRSIIPVSSVDDQKLSSMTSAEVMLSSLTSS